MSSSCACSSGSFDALQTVHRGTQGSERILELVRHVGRERLGGVDPVAQAVSHIVQRAGEQADLVAATRNARQVDLPRAPKPHPMRRQRQQSQRPGDGPGEEAR